MPVVYSDAERALAACTRIDLAKQFRDKAEAMIVYAKQAKNPALVVEATKVRFEAETKCGGLLIAMAVEGKRATRTDNLKRGPRTDRKVRSEKPTLEALGITERQSHRWQQLAKRKDAFPDLWQKQLDRLCRIAAAVTEGDRAVLEALNAEKHANAKTKRDVAERLLASAIKALPEKNTAWSTLTRRGALSSARKKG
jgi:hypothetical protein